MSDVLYYYDCAREKLVYKLDSIVQKMGGLYYIPPADSYEDFRDIQEEEWIFIITQIAKAGGYEAVILDLTEQVRGVYSLLEMCDKIYTLIRDDRMAKAKMAQYELMLEQDTCGRILEKTEKCRLPVFKNLPLNMEHLSRGSLADYVEKQIREDGVL